MRNDKSQTSSFKNKVIVIGAGTAGLYAGVTLKKHGIDYEILEATDRVGGRLGKLEGFADFPIDLGAQWLHGKRNVLGRLIKRTGTKISKDRTIEHYWFRQQFTKKLPKDLIGALEGNNDSPDISFLEYSGQKGFGEEYRYIVEQIAGDQGADATDLSIKWNALEEREWSSGNTDFKFQETFFDLINDHIASKVIDNVRLNTIIEHIDYAGERIQLRDKSGNIYNGNKVLLTVPITILKGGDITFNPPLPKTKTEAFHKIGMGPGMKVWMKFKERFYHDSISGGSVCAAYSDEIEGKLGKDHVLMAFVMGDQAQKLTELGSHRLITEALLTELDLMYKGRATELFIKSYVQDWTTHPFIKGAYSYSKVGIGDARKIAAFPVSNKIYFAGEAMNLNGHHQSVHGAAETGIAVADQIAQSHY